MDATDPLQALDALDRRFTEDQMQAAASKKALFEGWAEAVKAGHSPETIAARLRDGKTEEQIQAGTTFTAAYIRKIVRQHGAAPLPTGPKAKEGKR